MSAIQLNRIFPQFEPELISEMEASGSLKSIREGETIIQSGQNIRSALLVVDGLIKIYREDKDGHEFFMYHLDSGQACALSLVCAVKQETSEILAKAVTETTLLAIPLPVVDRWMRKYPGWAQFALESYRSRFEELLKTIDQIAFQNLDQRLLYYLQKHVEKTGSRDNFMQFTQIAQELNSSREVVSRLMKKLSEKGMIILHRDHIEIVNLEQSPA